jgi:DNA (cytosine-5)-methyltransferase 1
MTHGSLFSGIGGFDLAAEWMGWENKFHCEWNEFGQKILKYYWPNAESFDDITKTDFTKYANTIDILTGGFPCQPYSAAGKRLGKEDERHLWPEMLRAIKEIAPRWVVGENVRGLTTWNDGLVFNEVCSEMESIGYSVAPFIIPACSVNAPHKRERVWIIAYATSKGRREQSSESQGWENRRSDYNDEIWNATNSYSSSLQGRDEQAQEKRQIKGRRIKPFSEHTQWKEFPTESPVCSRDDGFSDRLDSIAFPKWRNESLKAYGNAVVPQVVYQIFKAISQYELLHNA